MDCNGIKAIIFTLLLLGLLPGISLAAEPSAWAGPYIGIHGGEGAVSRTFVVASGSHSAAFNMNGSMGGAQLGYKWAAGQAVLGLEVKGSVAEIHGSVACVGALVGRCGAKLEQLYTTQANVGISVGKLLAYLFAGAASGQIEVRNESPGSVYATSDRHIGILAGVGGLWALNDKLNGMIEMQYTDFGTNDYLVNNVNVSVQTHLTSLIFGLNYLF